jgi:putative membrane protein insertion efficiency factor
VKRCGSATRLPLLGWSGQALTLILICMVRTYQRGISPLLGPSCRFHPTCSEYMIGSIRKHGPLRGSLRGAFRVLRCHPFSRGGYDPP